MKFAALFVFLIATVSAQASNLACTAVRTAKKFTEVELKDVQPTGLAQRAMEAKIGAYKFEISVVDTVFGQISPYLLTTVSKGTKQILRVPMKYPTQEKSNPIQVDQTDLLLEFSDGNFMLNCTLK